MSAAPVIETPAPGLGGLWRRLALAMGPGLVVMLADTDAGSVITASQSGAQWGYRLVLPQLLAIPLLFAAQEITIRLGAGSGVGLAELIARRYGRPAALAALALLLASCFGALVTQLGAIGGLAESLGLPAAGAVLAAVAFLVGVVTLGVYASVERVAILAGLFEIAFLAVAWRSHPDLGAVRRERLRQDIILGVLPQIWDIMPFKSSMGAVMLGGMIGSLIFCFLFTPIAFYYIELLRRKCSKNKNLQTP